MSSFDVSYTKAYKAYSQKNWTKCLDLLKALPNNDTKRLDLEAQVHVMRKDYQKAYDIYSELIRRETTFREERKMNIQTLIICAELECTGQLRVNNKEKIPSIDDIINQVDKIALLEDTGLNLGSDVVKKTRRPRKRRIRLPKQYDPEVAPDPERWIPRRDRKGAAHKQKKRRQRPNIKGKPRIK